MVEVEVDVVVAEVEMKAVEVGLTLVVETVEANERDGKCEPGGGRHGGSGGHGVSRSGGGAGEDGGGVVERFSDSVFRI